MWRIELFGGVRAIRGDRVVSCFRSAKSGSLLGYLARYPGRMHSRERLAEMFWPGADAGRGRASLSTSLWSLRQALDSGPADSPELLVTSRDSISISPHFLVSDVGEFTALLADLRTATSRQRADLLEKAAELYAGEFMAGYYEDWVLAEQTQFASQYRALLKELVSLLERRGDIHRAIGYAARAVEFAPLSEENQRLLVELHIRAGNLEQARRQYAQFERLLARELGRKPAAALRELVAGNGHGATGLTRPADTRRNPVAEVGLRSGTFTVLSADRSERRDHRALPRRLRMALAELVRRYGGADTGRVSTFVALFSGTEEALACAAAIRQTEVAAAGKDRLCLVLETGRVDVDDDGCHGVALRQASRLLRGANRGWTLCSERTAAVAALGLDPHIRLRDLGSYRLPGSAMPERVFSIHWQDGEDPGCPPLQAMPERRGSVPVPLTPLFGRDRERTRLRELLLQPAARLVALLGPAGIGKTALGVRVAQDLQEAGLGLVWHVSLGSVADVGGMREAILQVVRPGAGCGGDAADPLVAALGPEICFLILDGLEHLLPAGACLVSRLLEGCPGLRCLATSRRALGIAGETCFPLDPLPVPRMPEEVLDCPTVQLFADRVRAIQPDFQITPANREEIAALCSRLEGIPLAVVLAAGRCDVMTPRHLLERLGQRFALLAARPGPAAPERHRSLEAALAANVALLSRDARLFLGRLSVFCGGFALEAAESVGENRAAADYLAELRGCSLLAGALCGAHLRFGMLDTIREFAGSLLDVPDLERCRRNHAEYFGQMARDATRHLGTAQARDALEGLDLDRENLDAALAWYQSRDPVAALQFAGTLAHHWEVRGLWRHGCQALAGALAHAPVTAMAERSQALRQLGWLNHLGGDSETGRRQVEQSLELARAIGSKPLTARACHSLAEIAVSQRRREDAVRMFEECGELARVLGYRDLEALVLSGMAWAKAGNGEHTEAVRLYEASLDLWREVGSVRGIAVTFRNMAVAAEARGEWAEARRCHEESLVLFREIADPVSVADNLRALSAIAERGGHMADARGLIDSAIAAIRPAESPRHLARLLHVSGRLAAEAGDPALAWAQLGESRELYRRLHDAKADERVGELLAKLPPPP